MIRQAAGRPGPSPAPPGRGGPPPPGSRGRRTTRRRRRAGRAVRRRGAPQLQLQQVSEQPVVAEPGPPRIQRGHERAGLLQLLQHPLPARAPGQQVGQLAVDPVQHRGPQQQPPDRLALPLQHLGQQVLRHRALAAGELGREPVRIRVPGQRQRGQPQPRRPALGPLMQQPQRRVGQLYPGRLEQRPLLLPGEAQVGPRGSRSARPPAAAGAGPAADHGGWPARTAAPAGARMHQQLQLAQRLGRAQLVHVVDHQPDPVLEPAQVFQQPLDDRPVRPGRGPPSAAAPASTRRRSPAARRAPTARTAAGRAPRPAPPPTRHARPGPPRPIQERSRTVFPLPAGADTSVTRPAPASSPNSPGRKTTPSRTTGAAAAPAAPDRSAGPTAPSLAGPPLTLRLPWPPVADLDPRAAASGRSSPPAANHPAV